MKKSEYETVISSMHSIMDMQRANKNAVPKGAITRETLDRLPIGTCIWLVWALGPNSWITKALTRKEHSYDHKSDHLGEAFWLDMNEVFLISKNLDTEYEKANFSIYAHEHYASYNLNSKGYNDSYVFLQENLALAHLEFCKSLPRFKTEEERIAHEETMQAMNEIGDRMADDFIDDPRYDLEDTY